VRLLDPETTDFNTVYNQFRWSVPDRLNIAIQVCERHQSEPDRIAVYYENIDGETAVFSFGQLKTLSDQFANVLRGQGVTRGDRVAIRENLLTRSGTCLTGPPAIWQSSKPVPTRQPV